MLKISSNSNRIRTRFELQWPPTNHHTLHFISTWRFLLPFSSILAARSIAQRRLCDILARSGIVDQCFDGGTRNATISKKKRRETTKKMTSWCSDRWTIARCSARREWDNILKDAQLTRWLRSLEETIRLPIRSTAWSTSARRIMRSAGNNALELPTSDASSGNFICPRSRNIRRWISAYARISDPAGLF